MSKKYLMSSTQKRIYTVEQVQGENDTYNIPITFQLSQPINLEKLENSLNELIERHQVLRTYFEMIDGKFGQIIEEKYQVTIELVTDSLNTLEMITKEFIRPFNTGRLPLLRVCYCTLVTGEMYLLLDAHHIIMDGGSMGIFLAELSQLYNGKKLQPMKLQYKDYSAWHRKKDKSLSKQFWLEEFSEGLPEFELFYDYPRPKESAYLGDTVSTRLSLEQIKQLNQLTEQTSATNYMIFIACFMIFLSKYSGSQEVVIGTTMSGRNHPDIQHLLGMFVNTVPINDKIQPNEDFISYLEGIKHKMMQVFDHQDYPLDEIIAALDVPVFENKHPIFDILFNYQSNGQFDATLGDSKLTEVSRDSHVAKFDLTFNLGTEDNQVELVWEYDVHLFKKATIERMQQHFVILMGDILADPTKSISEFTCLNQEEEAEIMTTFNKEEPAIPESDTVIVHFKEQVAKHAADIAIKGTDQTLTYAELDNESSRIAGMIQEKGIESGIVAIIAAREVQTIIAYLGILKAGCAYLPLDPKSPKKRNREILEQSQARLLIDFREEGQALDFSLEQVTFTDLKRMRPMSDYQLKPLTKHTLAYVIYTSGTTGEPKGTMIEHKSIIRLVKDPNYITLNRPKILQTGSLTFDASTFEIWGALLNGGTLYVSDIENLVDPDKLQQIIENNKIDVMWLTSSLFNQLVSLNEHIFASLKYLLIGGEKLSTYHVSKFKQVNKQTHLINGYGPTECTTFALTYEITEPFMELIPIGKPINNTSALVFEKESLCGIGMPGELYLGGEGLARGYLGNKGLTNEKFINHPFKVGEKLYKTGDLVRWNEEGLIDYLGRIDQQVKIRGFRIELKEIEVQLLSIPEIKEATVRVVENETKTEKQLIAYISTEREIAEKQIKEYLRSQLPEYMIPKGIVFLEYLPITKNGKLAINLLPKPIVNMEKGVKELPENQLQSNMLAIFKEILNLEEIGINENFYDLGGESIKAIRIVSKLKEQGYSLTINDILHYRTIKELSNNLKQNKQLIVDQSDVTGTVLFTPIQQKFFEEKLNAPNHFNQSIMLEFSNEKLDQEKIENALQALMIHHDMLRATYNENQMIQGSDSVESFSLEQHIFEQESQRINWFDETTDSYRSMQKRSNQAQASLSLSEGKIFKAVIYQFKDSNFLLLIAHHLVVDTISWKIILEDLETACQNLISDQKVKLPLKTMSYKNWSQELVNYSNTEELRNELPFWKETAAIVEKSQLQIKSDSGKEHQLAIFSTQLGVEKTAELLKQKSRFSHFHVKELLITALVRAISTLSENPEVSLLMEGHGREQLTAEIEIDRTVGWFTITYPVAFSLRNEGVEADILQVNQSLQAIPNNGIGYGLTKTIKPDISTTEPMVTFNYSGEFNESKQADHLFTMSPAPQGNEVSSDNPFGTPIAVNLVIVDKNLNSNISYDKSLFSAEFIQKLADLFLKEIDQIVEFLENEAQYVSQVDPFLPQSWAEYTIKQSIQPSAMQKMFLETLEQTMIYALFELHASDQDCIIDALKIVIKEQPLLRTSYAKTGGEYVLYEHKFDDKFTAPFIDLSMKSEKEIYTFQEEMKKKMVAGFNKNQSTALYHMLLTKINAETFILHVLISHSVWDKYSDTVFYDRLKECITDHSKPVKVVNEDTLLQPNITSKFDLKKLQEHFLLFRETKEAISVAQTKDKNFIIRLSILHLGEKTKKYYAKNHWTLIMHLAKIIIRQNQAINQSQTIPVYIVQENRKYMPVSFAQAIGPYIDLWPILLEGSSTGSVYEVENQMAYFQQLKMKTQINLIDELSKIDPHYTDKGIYSINNQTIFELTKETLEIAKKQVEKMGNIDGFEIVINKYLDQLVLIYPENKKQANQLDSVLQKACDQLELDLA